MDFWTRLKHKIKENNTTQEWIANKIDVPFSTFKKWLSKKTYPDIREGVLIARLLNTTVEELVEGDEGKQYILDLISKEESSFNDEERLLILFRKLVPEMQNIVLKKTREMLKTYEESWVSADDGEKKTQTAKVG
jgi:transcriptional regulator with XRE-family HTH domain